MMKFSKITIPALLLPVFFLFVSPGCDKDDGDRMPLPPTNITINPNSTIYQEINFVGGWMYLDESDGVEPPSRGIIVYRATTDMFMAYERTPPFKPDSCCNAGNTVCTALVVDYPYIIDTCTQAKYIIIDGSPSSGPSSMPLGMYVAEYYGELLFIHD